MSQTQVPDNAIYTWSRGSGFVRDASADRSHAHLLKVLEWSALFYLCAVTFILLIDPRLPSYQKLLIGSLIPAFILLIVFYPLKLSELIATVCFVAAGFIGYFLRSDHYVSWTISGVVYTLAFCLFWIAGRHSVGILFRVQSATLVSSVILTSCMLSVVTAVFSYEQRASAPPFLASALFLALLQLQRHKYSRVISGAGLVVTMILAYLSGWLAPFIIMATFAMIVAGLTTILGALVEKKLSRLVATALILLVMSFAAASALWSLSEETYFRIAESIQTRYEKLWDPYALNIELAIRIQESKDALRQFVEEGNVVTFLIGFGHGATFDATTVRNMLGTSIEWWQDRFSESGDAHVIHFGVMRWLYRHGVFGLIFAMVTIVLAAKDFVKTVYRIARYGGFVHTVAGAILIGSGSILMFAARGLLQPVEWDPMLWYSVGLWVYGRQQQRLRHVQRPFAGLGMRQKCVKRLG